MIKYLGSKRALIPQLGALFSASGAYTALDLFTGTTRVAQEFQRQGARTIACDIATYSHVLAQTYVELDAGSVRHGELDDALAYLANLPGTDGYFTETFCRQSRYFQPQNGMRVDVIREAIETDYKDTWLYPVLLTSLMEAADAVDSTVGLQMAYLKEWAKRSYNPLTLKKPEFTPGAGRAVLGDANELVLHVEPVDLAYLDPPYNQHRYFTNYHVWETLVRWDKPESYGIACKRVDARDEETKSVFNKKREMPDAFANLVKNVQADTLMVSFSNEGFIPLDGLVSICEARGDAVEVLEFSHKRYIGSQIGIYNLDGKKVGEKRHDKNTEYVILAGQKSRIAKMRDALG